MLCMPVNEPPSLKNEPILRKVTPNITGIDKKNENSAATNRDAPKIIAPKIVAPERDVPGTIDST